MKSILTLTHTHTLILTRMAGLGSDVLPWSRMAASYRTPYGDLGRTRTHQFFVHFCFDIPGKSEKCLWKEQAISAL